MTPRPMAQISDAAVRDVDRDDLAHVLIALGGDLAHDRDFQHAQDDSAYIRGEEDS